MSDGKKWTCGKCSSDTGVYEEKAGSADHLFELTTCERDPTAPPCEDSTDKSV